MKKYLKLIPLSIAVITLIMTGGCEKPTSTEDNSKITYYVTYDLEDINDFGETLVELGSDYAEPGFTATEGSEDVTSNVEVTGSVDPNTVGVYNITYSAVNEDGFPASAQRTVIVYDPEAPDVDLTGAWAGTVLRYIGESTTGPFNTSLDIRKVANGFFYLSDWLAGFYSQGYGYGSAYASPGYFSLSPENEINFEGEISRAFGIPVGELQNATYDPETNTIQQNVIWNGTWNFEETLNKI